MDILRRVMRSPDGSGGAPDGGQPGNAPASAPAGGQPNGGTEPWYSGIQNEDLRTWIAGKNFPDIQTAIESHRNLEKLLGSDKIALPTGDDDKEGWDRLYNAIGRPTSPEGYKLLAPQGVELDKDLVSGFTKAAHALGISQKAAQGLLNWYLGAQEAQATALRQQAEEQAKAAEAQSEKEINELRTEWGKDFDANIEAAKRAARQFGVGEETLSKIEEAIGTKELLSLFHRIGVGLGEDTAVGLNGGASGFGMTKDQARAKLSEILANPAYFDAGHPMHNSLVSEATRLNKIILGLS